MISKISGQLIEKKEHSVVIDVSGLSYEVLVPISVLQRIEETTDPQGQVSLITYYYFQMTQSSGHPVLVGFISEIERDFFLQFIKVSGIGPRAAVKALNKSISEITRAIDQGDAAFLKTLPGIGAQKAKEVVAKLQGKVGRFGLIQDAKVVTVGESVVPDWQDEALTVLLQLQYKKQEALDMIKKALDRSKTLSTTEELLNEIYKQKVNS